MKNWKLSFRLFIITFAIIVFGNVINTTIVSAETTDSSDMTSNGFEYSIVEDSSITITGYSGSNKEVVIPSQIDGKPVTRIGECAFKYHSKIANIIIPNSITSIDNNAFRGCSSLTSVSIPDSVTVIAFTAFSGCSSLTSISIPNSVTDIGIFAFSGCSSLTSISIPDSVTSISEHAFHGCSSLTSISIPNSVTDIGISAFSGCSSLTSISIPDSVTHIGDSAFSGCTDLYSISLPDDIYIYDSDNDNAFNDCPQLTIYVTHESSTSKYAEARNIPFVIKHEKKRIDITATCTTDGYQQTICEDCGKILDSQSLPAIGHDITWETTVAPTCIKKGEKQKKCKNCGIVYAYEILPIVDHDVSNWITDKEPTCTTDGTKSGICNFCNEKQTKKINALGHNHVKEVKKVSYYPGEITIYTCKRCEDGYRICSTCNAKGYTTKNCTSCKSSGSIEKSVNCTKCNGSGKITEHPSCTLCHGSGKWYGAICTACMGTGIFDDYIVTKTCTSCNGSGSKKQKTTCTSCKGRGTIKTDCYTCLGIGKFSLTEEERSHKYGEWIITIPATATTPGLQERICTLCGKTDTQNIPCITTGTSDSHATPSSKLASTPSHTPQLQTPQSTPTSQPPTNITQPSQVSKLTAKNKKKKTVTLTWKKTSNASGYELQYATNKKFKSCKKKICKKTKITVKGLKKKKTYFFRVRSYRWDGSKKIYGKWSVLKKVKIKK